MEWYAKNPADYDRDTLGLTLAEHGAYNRLIDYYMLTEQPLPSSDRELAAICRCSVDEWLAVAPMVLRYFHKLEGKLHNKRCDEELKTQARLAEISRANGKKGGRPKGAKRQGEPSKYPTETQRDTQQKPSGSENETQEKPQTDIQTYKDSSLRSESPPGYSPEFEAAWAIYPKRAGSNPKKDAYRCWNARLKEGHAAETMMAGVRRYAAFIRATGKLGTEYVMQAQRFFGPSDPRHFEADWLPPRGSAGRMGMAEPPPAERFRQTPEQEREQQKRFESWGDE